jgi:hypothetical protein
MLLGRCYSVGLLCGLLLDGRRAKPRHVVVGASRMPDGEANALIVFLKSSLHPITNIRIETQLRALIVQFVTVE